MLASGFVALVTGLLLIVDFQIITGEVFPHYKQRDHDDNIRDALMNASLAPVLHLLVFIGSVMIFRRLWRK